MKAQDITNAIFSIAPNSEFTFQETDLDTLQWHSESAKPTKAQILKAIENNQIAKAEADAAKAAQKAALLERLGITADEAVLLLS